MSNSSILKIEFFPETEQLQMTVELHHGEEVEEISEENLHEAAKVMKHVYGFAHNLLRGNVPPQLVNLVCNPEGFSMHVMTPDEYAESQESLFEDDNVPMQEPSEEDEANVQH